MNELIVLTLHGGVEALVADLINRRACPTLLIAAQMRRGDLVAREAYLDTALMVLDDVVLRALARRA